MATDPFAVQSTEQAKQVAAADAWHREQARRANDTIRVANPSVITINGKPFKYPHGDYFVTWEQGRHRVPIDGTLDIVRYIATTYCREMFVEIVNFYGETVGQTLLERSGREKPEILLDKYLENKAVWDKVPKTDDERLMGEIWPQLWLGVVKEFGKDTPQDIDPRAGEVDFRSPEERVLQNLENKRVGDSETIEVPEIEEVLPPVELKSKKELIKEVTNDD